MLTLFDLHHKGILSLKAHNLPVTSNCTSVSWLDLPVREPQHKHLPTLPPSSVHMPHSDSQFPFISAHKEDMWQLHYLPTYYSVLWHWYCCILDFIQEYIPCHIPEI